MPELPIPKKKWMIHHPTGIAFLLFPIHTKIGGPNLRNQEYEIVGYTWDLDGTFPAVSGKNEFNGLFKGQTNNLNRSNSISIHCYRVKSLDPKSKDTGDIFYSTLAVDLGVRDYAALHPAR